MQVNRLATMGLAANLAYSVVTTSTVLAVLQREGERGLGGRDVGLWFRDRGG